MNAAETRAMRDCDALFGRYMHATRPRVCEKCLAVGPVEVAHIIGRRYWLLRCDERNVAMLCASCHRGELGVDQGGWEWPGLIGDRYLDLVALARNEGKRPHDWFRRERARLRRVWGEL